jgi:hypothetical protein
MGPPLLNNSNATNHNESIPKVEVVQLIHTLPLKESIKQNNEVFLT